MTSNSLKPETLSSEWRDRVEKALAHWLPTPKTLPTNLHAAMRYAALDGGKRIRPQLVYATGHALGIAAGQLDGAAAAVELIHVYSLIHDDLPVMDDDDLRRGKPTCHKAFDEATALLAGDAIQTLAFHVLSASPDLAGDARARLQMIETLSQAAGSRGMAGGQAIDLDAVGHELTLAELENMHIHKTGALIRASVKLGALGAPDASEETIEHLDHYAKCIGLAFQIRDDILDIEGETKTLGKTQGSDVARGKPTFPSLLGMDEAKSRANALYEDALNAIASLSPAADPLRWIAGFIVNRIN